MARATTRKSPVRKSISRAKKKRRKGASRPAGFNVARLFFFLCLLALFTLSIAIVGYVIFFRVVVAAEPSEIDDPIVFEVPDQLQTSVEEPTPREAQQLGHRVAIIIDDMGYHPRLGRDLLALEMNLTFSFLPHAPYTGEMEEEAYRRGRTVMLHLPLEPQGVEWDPGPGALYVGQSPEKHRQLLKENLQQVPHATGINNHMGSRFTEETESMAGLMDLVREHHLFFIDSYTTPKSQGMSMATAKGIPASRRHVFLDNVQQHESICARLAELIDLAGRQGDAIGIAHPHAETLQALSTCGVEILGGVTLVGVDELVDKVKP